MKLKKYFLLFSLISFLITYGQSGDFNCWQQTQPNQNQAIALSQTTTLIQGNVKMAVILCVEQGQSKVVPITSYLNRLKEITETYFRQASNGNFTVEVNFLTESEDPINGTASVYELNGMLIPYPDYGPDFVMQPALFQNLFQRVDAKYNFGNYDQNNDGVVDFLSLIVIRFAPGRSTGTTGLPGCDIDNYWMQTNDNWVVNGQIMGTMRVNGLGSQLPCKSIQQRKFNGDQYDMTLSIFTHELGHALFSFTDISTSWTVSTGDDALGDFCNMSRAINFGNRPSMYNPVLRVQNGWLNPTALTSGDKTFNDLLRTSSLYSYVLPGGNDITESGQAFYFTYHDKSSGSYFEEKWLIPVDNNLNSRGIMIWNHLASISQWTYYEWYHKPVDIIAAHGKWKWDLSDTVRSNPALNQYVTANNLYTPDPAKGMDSLEARYAYVKLRWINNAWLEEGVYQDKRKGSASCFFDPLNPKEFSFYSNPNSNLYLNSTAENYSKTVASNIKITNLRVEGSSTKANFIIGINANNITQNTTLVKGKWYFDQNVTINSGVTLTIEAGTNLYFASGASLIVNGTLNATSSTFTSANTWGGIRFNDGSSGNVNGCTINNVQTYGGAAVSIYNSATPTIQNCTINNNAGATSGVYFYQTSSPYLYNNTIQGNSYYGLYFNNANAYLRHNTISATGNYAAAYCYDHSTPLFAEPTGSWVGNNSIQNSYCGISANYYSTPAIGRAQPDNTYNNRVVSNTTNAYAGYGSTIYAQQVYWDATPPSKITQDGGTVYYNNPLQNDPGMSIEYIDNKYHNVTDYERLQQAHEFFLRGRYNDAVSIYVNIINLRSNKSLSETAIVELGNVYNINKNQSILDLIKIFSADKDDQFGLRAVALSTLGHVYSSAENYSSAIPIYESLISLYPGTMHESASRINLVYLYKSIGKDDLAKESLDIVKNKFPNDENILSAEWFLSLQTNMAGSFTKNIFQQSLTNGRSEQISELQLLENYPNPFNPTTKISFSIPQKSQIKLKVFDVLGREVADLADGVYEVGKYEVTFDASKLPSGVYFYNLTTGSNSISKKMLLVK